MTSTLVYAKTLSKLYSDMLAGGGRGAVVDRTMGLHPFEEIIRLKEVWEGVRKLEKK